MFDKKQYYIENREKIKKCAKQYRENNPERVKGNKKKWYKNNPEKAKEINKRGYIKNREKRLEHAKEYSKNNKEKISEYMKKYGKLYRENNHKKIREYNKLWNQDHPEKMKESNRKYRENNPEKRYYNKEYHRQYMNIRRKMNSKVNLNHKISKGIYKALRGNKAGRHWEDLVGYSLNDLVKRLKKTMPKGYSWQDFLSGKLHIDHCIPISVWDYDKSGQINFKRCWGLSNLQLLPARENLIKYNKLTKPFQLALRI